MPHLHIHRLLLLTVFACVAIASPARLDAESAPKLRLIFLSSLIENDGLVIATPGKEGEWIEHGELKARSSFISEWIEVRAGELHLARRTPEGLDSKGRFVFPQGARSALAVVVSDPDTQTYRGRVIDPAKHRFELGSCLLMNLSEKKAMVVLGKTRITVEAGAMQVTKATPEENGMYRMMVGYNDTEDELIVCYDRYVADNPKSRDFLFLISDSSLGLRVLSLPEFGGAD